MKFVFVFPTLFLAILFPSIQLELSVSTYRFGPLKTNVNVISSSKKEDEIVVIDAPPKTIYGLSNRGILHEEKNTKVHLLLTHGHWDHASEARDFVEKFGAKIYMSPSDYSMFLSPLKDGKYEKPFRKKSTRIPSVEVENVEFVHDGQMIKDIFNDTEIRVHLIGGHTKGSIAFHFAELNSVFVGDTLFKGAVGKAQDIQEFTRSISNKLFPLPLTTNVFPGHGDSTTIQDEIRNNRFFTDIKDEALKKFLKIVDEHVDEPICNNEL